MGGTPDKMLTALMDFEQFLADPTQPKDKPHDQ